MSSRGSSPLRLNLTRRRQGKGNEIGAVSLKSLRLSEGRVVGRNETNKRNILWNESNTRLCSREGVGNSRVLATCDEERMKGKE